MSARNAARRTPENSAVAAERRGSNMFSQEELIGLFLADDKSEFKSADELDDATLMSIRKKYFKGLAL